MIGQLPEAGGVIHDEFREGNIGLRPARTSNLFRRVKTHLPRGHRAAHVHLDTSTPKAIEAIPESNWKHYADCAIAETTHSINNTHKAFRLIVVKYKRQAELFDDQPKYHVIASNRVESTADTLICTLALKIAAEFVELFQDIRTRSHPLAQSLAP